MRPRRNRRHREFAWCEFACSSSTWRSSSAASSLARRFYKVRLGSTRTLQNSLEHISKYYDVEKIINLTSPTRPRHHTGMRFRVFAVVGVVGRIIGRPDTDPGK